MTDREPIAEFIRLESDGSRQWLAVREIGWDGPYTPVSSWKRLVEVAADASDEELAELKQSLLENESYFGICQYCHERNPVGWMTG